MPWSAQIHAKFHVHRITQELPRRSRIFGYGPLTLWGAGFHRLHLISELPYRGPTTPGTSPPVWAVPLSLATTYGIVSLSFPLVTEMFHFTRYRSNRPMYSDGGDWT